MAEIPRVQGFRAQIAQAPGAATPQVSFGQQQRPEMAFQAQAQYQDTLGQVLDRISQTLFGVAEKQTVEEGMQYVVGNPASEQAMKDMIAGKTETPDLGNPFNLYNAAVRKARSIELAAYAEREGKRKATELLTKAELGQTTTEQALNDLRSYTDGASKSLARMDPDASLKFRATMNVIGSSVIDGVAKAELKRHQLKNEAGAEMEFNDTLSNIAAMLDTDVVSPDIERKIVALQEGFFQNTGVTVSLESSQAYAKRFRDGVEQMKAGKVVKFISQSDNPTKAYDDVVRGKTQDQYINSLVSTRSPLRFRILDAASKELRAMNSLQEQQEQIDARQVNVLEAEFYDALASNNMGRVSEILGQVRTLSPTKYVAMKKDSSGAGVFAVTDNPLVVSDLELRVNAPYGKVITVGEIAKQRSQLTQATFVRLVNSAKSANDEQIKMMKEQAANQLGMARGPVLNRDIQRQRQEKAISDLEVRFVNARRLNPNLDPFEWLDANFESSTKISTQNTDKEIVSRVTSRTNKTIAAFDAAIKDAQRTNQADQHARLIKERNELQDAIKQGLVDENGNAKK
jgi:hypothetical protein